MDTLVVLMGVGTLRQTVRSLLAHGRDAATPVAVIQEGTLPGERIATGTLATIAKRVRCSGIHPPAVIVVGEVATFRSALLPGASALAVGRSGRPPSKLAAAARKAPL